MKNGIAILSFTDRGEAIGGTLAAALRGCACRGVPVGAWTKENFSSREALVFVGAVGIAVRAIAPYVRSKDTDPAVISVDEAGKFVIPLLSGHLGGANALARQIADQIGATAVITTATDLRGVFAVDLWAKAQNLVLLHPERIKRISSALLAGKSVDFYSPWQVEGTVPPGIALGQGNDLIVDVRRPYGQEALQLVPKAVTVGIGCKRGVSMSALEQAWKQFQNQSRICPESIAFAASIDRKRDETGLLEFCAAHHWPIRFFSAEELSAVAGLFTASPFVQQTVGVENVCERAAVLCSGGTLLEKKYASDGVTFALAVRQPKLNWRYNTWERYM